jgi:hypothetical protein
MGSFGAVSVAAFAYFYVITKDLSVAVARIDQHLESVDASLERVDKRFEAIDKRFEAIDARFDGLELSMDRRFDAMERRFDALTTLILNMQPPMKRTEGFKLAPGLGSRQ